MKDKDVNWISKGSKEPKNKENKNNGIIDLQEGNVNKSFKELNTEEQYKFISKKSKPKQAFYLMRLHGEKRKELLKHIKNVNASINKVNENFSKDNLFEVRNFNFYYSKGKKQALFDINLDIKKGKVTSLIGPSGCGKSTFLKNLNRMSDLVDDVVVDGDIYFNGINIRSKKIKDVELRSEVGMVFQKPTPFDMSIYDNVAFGPKSHGVTNKKVLDKIVEEALKGAALWDEVKNDLHTSNGTGLSGGQQQRLCIARAIALRPKVLLMDEPTSALDPIATAKIENLIIDLSKTMTIIIVTHSMAQAQRVSDETVFFYQGKVVEYGRTKDIFTKPKEKQTRDYVNGKIG